MNGMNGMILPPEELGSAAPRRGFSDACLLGAINRLASNVSVMENAVMVPSRLMGLSSDVVRDVVKEKGNCDDIDQGTDMYMYFNMLKTLKTELVRGTTPNRSEREDLFPSPPNSNVSRSSTCSSICSANDSEDEGESQDRSLETEQTIELFRMHLKGLVQIMNKLSDSSDLITRTYQQSIVKE